MNYDRESNLERIQRILFESIEQYTQAWETLGGPTGLEITIDQIRGVLSTARSRAALIVDILGTASPTPEKDMETLDLLTRAQDLTTIDGKEAAMSWFEGQVRDLFVYRANHERQYRNGDFSEANFEEEQGNIDRQLRAAAHSITFISTLPISKS